MYPIYRVAHIERTNYGSTVEYDFIIRLDFRFSRRPFLHALTFEVRSQWLLFLQTALCRRAKAAALSTFCAPSFSYPFFVKALRQVR